MQLNFLKERTRMFNEDHEYYMLILNNGVTDEKLVEITEKWSETNKRKTRLQDFLEKYPKATVRDDGCPFVLPCHLGYLNECNKISCDRKTCWNEPLE